MNKPYDPSINKQLKPSSLKCRKDGFDAIMDQSVPVQKTARSFQIPAVAAAVLATIMLWQLPNFKKTQLMVNLRKQSSLTTSFHSN
jgi:hypothetical protein